jgi:hypothetical protein
MSLSLMLLPKGKNASELTISSPILSPNSLDPIFRLLASLKEREVLLRETLKKVVEEHLEDIIAFNRNAEYLSVIFEGIEPTTPYQIDLLALISRLFDMGTYSLKIKENFEKLKDELESLSMLLNRLIEDFIGKLHAVMSKFVKPLKSQNDLICPLTGGQCLLEKCVFFDFDKGCLLLAYLNF